MSPLTGLGNDITIVFYTHVAPNGAWEGKNHFFCNFHPIEPIDPTVHLRVSFLWRESGACYDN
jgi:hypothetical protein